MIPAIKAKWPGRQRYTTLIQQDNALSHRGISKKVLESQDGKDEWKIEMSNQLANSPDLNILALGFFNAIQSLQQQKYSTNIDHVIESVSQCYNRIASSKLNITLITLQSVMEKILEHKGNNGFKIPLLNCGMTDVLVLVQLWIGG